jgi:hypothetical protein
VCARLGAEFGYELFTCTSGLQDVCGVVALGRQARVHDPVAGNVLGGCCCAGAVLVSMPVPDMPGRCCVNLHCARAAL